MANQIGLGRVKNFDDRDYNFTLPRPHTLKGLPVRKYWWPDEKAWDQGATSECVAYSGSRLLVAGPVTNDAIECNKLYRECKEVDEWPGDEYEGTSVRALMKVLKRRGLIESYHWTWEVNTIVEHLMSVGPLVVGTTWHLDMFMPDKWGYIAPTGPPVGGHAYTIIGVNRGKKHPLTGHEGALRVLNSWGPNWGEDGRAWLSFAHMQRLLDDYGEACVVKEIDR